MKKEPKAAKSSFSGTVITVILFLAAFFLATPVTTLMTRLTASLPIMRINWAAPFQLVMLICGLHLVFLLAVAALKKWSPKTSHGRTFATLAHSALRYVLAILGLLWALAILGVDVRALIAGAGIVALVIGFGAESLIADVITGVFMLFEHQYEVGDIIVVGDFRGTVTQIGIRTTSITDAGGNTKIINNSDIRNIINRSSESSFATSDIAIPYQGYLHRAEDLLKELLPAIYQQHTDLFLAVPEYSGVQQLNINQSAVLLRVSAKVAEKDIYAAQRVLNRELLLAFEDAGIPSPAVALKSASV